MVSYRTGSEVIIQTDRSTESFAARIDEDTNKQAAKSATHFNMFVQSIKHKSIHINNT